MARSVQIMAVIGVWLIGTYDVTGRLLDDYNWEFDFFVLVCLSIQMWYCTVQILDDKYESTCFVNQLQAL